MKNEYEVKGDITIIYAKDSKGKTHKVLIDTEDLELVKWITGSWTVNNHGYVTGSFHGRNILMHRLVMKALNAIYEEVDHVNHNRLDNRKSHLRLVTRSENQQNRRIGKNNRSGVMGVSYNPEAKRWIARIKVSGKTKSLGTYCSKEDAIIARKEGEKKYHTYKQEIRHLQTK